MIRRFTLKGFRRFDRETPPIDLAPITVLLGANNSGKSTVLQALNLFQYCIETTRKAEGNGKNGTANLKLGPRTVSPDEFGTLPVADPGDLWPQGVTRQKPIVLIAEYDNGAKIGFDLSISYNRFSIKPMVVGEVATVLRNGAIRLIPIFSGFVPREEFLTPPARLDRMRLQRHGEMIRNSLWDIKENAPEQWTKLVELLRRLFPASGVSVDFDMDVDRFIRADYHDGVLTKDRDLIAAGSGFHQALQIFAAVLAPGASTVLLDEPDAHLHARLQGQLMSIFEELSRETKTQFVVATHSPHLLGASPVGSVRVCLDGKVVPLAVEPEQLQLLETVGAMDRMEIVPLLTNRAVVFVENKADRKLLAQFAQKLWGDKKQEEVWSRLTFLYTYQDPVAAGVLDLGRQVRELLAATGTGAGRPVRMLAIGDRDYRTAKARAEAIKETRRKARTDPFKLDLVLYVWKATEIENHIIDPGAILANLDAQAAEVGEWRQNRAAFGRKLSELLAEHRSDARERVATRIQQADRRLDIKAALEQADATLNAEWGDGAAWCDAKRVLSSLRGWLDEKGLRLQLSERAIIEKMAEVPAEVEKVLKDILRVAGLTKTRARSQKKV